MKKFLVILLIVALCLTLCACSNDGNGLYGGGVANSGEGATSLPTAPNRKIYYTVDTSISVQDLNKAIYDVKALMQSGEWAEREYLEQTYATIVLRIKTDRLDSFLKGLEQMGEVSSFTKQSVDVTEAYVSNEQKIATLTAEKAALTSLLSTATNTADVLAITKRMSEIDIELQQLSNAQQKYDSLIDYSVVTIRLYQKDTVNPDSFGAKLLNGLSITWELFQALIIFIICLIPFGIIAGGIVVIVIVTKRKKKAKKLEQEGQNSQPPQE